MPSFPQFGRWAATPVRSPLPRPGPHPKALVRGVVNFSLSGVTRDASGNPLGSCVVKLMRSGDDSFVAQVVSDGLGNYSFTRPENAGTFYVTIYKAGSPDVAGISVNTLVLS